MFLLNTKKTLWESLVEFFSTDIPYKIRVKDGDWSQYFGYYQNQKWGKWDSDSCWCLSAVNCLEDQLEWLWRNNFFSEEAKKFFIDNGYLDHDGDFSISERFTEIVSGVKDNGNNQKKAWDLFEKYGILPRSKLNYSEERASQFSNKEDFVKDYFNRNEVTQEMLDIARNSKKYIKIQSKWINAGSKMPSLDVLRRAILQAPLQFGLAVPKLSYLWGRPGIIEWDGQITINHAVECYKINGDGSFEIFDQYVPNLKILSSEYYIPYITQGIVSVR